MPEKREGVLLSDTLRPAVEAALKDLRDHECLLDGYHLTVDTKDTKVDLEIFLMVKAVSRKSVRLLLLPKVAIKFTTTCTL